MTQAEVDAKIKTSSVKKAFEMTKIESLPNEVQMAYEEQDMNFSRYSLHTNSLIQEGKAEAVEMLTRHYSLPKSEVQQLLSATKSATKSTTGDEEISSTSNDNSFENTVVAT